jgi:DNA-binding beta-propeller fold protein YncE
VKRALLLLAILAVPAASQAASQGGVPVALVTAETENQLIAVQLPSGRILKRLPMPADPENVEAGGDAAVVVSTRGGAVTVVQLPRLRIRRTIRGFRSPHIVALSPRGGYAYVTDDARGQLAVIGLARARIVRRIFVGVGAHHMTFSPDGRRLWIALGERASTLTVVDTRRLARPRVVGHVDPRGLAHDLAFAPDGRTVWVTYDDRSTIAVFDARTGRRLYSLAAGSPPQHIVFGVGSYGRYALVTSGNDGVLRIVSARSRRTVRTLRTPRGSFNLGLGGSFILTSSLTHGTLTEFDFQGHRRFLKKVAPAARDVALVVVP